MDVKCRSRAAADLRTAIVLSECDKLLHQALFTACNGITYIYLGHDWCIIQLGVPGVIHGFHVDTHFFTGNYAPRISVQVACLQDFIIFALNKLYHCLQERTELDLLQMRKILKPSIGYIPKNGNLLKMTELKPGYADSCHNFFHISSKQRWTHIRLNIYPDGGIARFKVYGIGQRDWSLCGPNDVEDLLSMTNGSVCLGYSDAHYGHPRHLIGLGRAADMGDGWETARRLDRPPVIKADENGILQVLGNEWTVFRLGHPGLITHIEIDTNHFKDSGTLIFKVKCEVSTINDGLGSRVIC
ncbi:unnamed protein product [Ranitomeya imitator]|uniref:Allantoate amidinohydrolase n=1 Tax=Ranitomeya imitator TaxID=111125 RepID=A0ABN9L8X7_9NEOB|nr:unnamed protein product [Ranitomeya imitator]